MNSFPVQNQRVVVVCWKNKSGNPFEVYSSLKNFCLAYKEYIDNKLSNYLSKRKMAFDHGTIRIERKVVITKPLFGQAVTGRHFGMDVDAEQYDVIPLPHDKVFVIAKI